jgi:hypothetical protein
VTVYVVMEIVTGWDYERINPICVVPTVELAREIVNQKNREADDKCDGEVSYSYGFSPVEWLE